MIDIKYLIFLIFYVFLQITNSVLSLLDFYKWNKFSIIYQEGAQWETIAKHLNEQVNMKLN